MFGVLVLLASTLPPAEPPDQMNSSLAERKQRTLKGSVCVRGTKRHNERVPHAAGYSVVLRARGGGDSGLAPPQASKLGGRVVFNVCGGPRNRVRAEKSNGSLARWEEYYDPSETVRGWLEEMTPRACHTQQLQSEPSCTTSMSRFTQISSSMGLATRYHWPREQPERPPFYQPRHNKQR